MVQILADPTTRASLVDFCHRWRITELAILGSALRDDFKQESDIDLLVTFAPKANWSLLDHMRMELELVKSFGREVDLIDRRALEARGRLGQRSQILNTAQVIYSADEPERVAR
jgi:predicted nucleotidyltransferase